jgi:Fur family ferric uptake transcriptional regulator
MSESFENWEEQPSELLKLLLHQEGFRLTSQRQKILKLFQSSCQGDHLSAEEIYQKLKNGGETISFSTIYRALHVMVKLGLLQELELAEDRKYYEIKKTAIEQHYHLVCVQCGAVLEFEDPSIGQVTNAETNLRGFTCLGCQFTVYGLCGACLSQGPVSPP